MPTVHRNAPEKVHWQTVLFPREGWTKKSAESWLKTHSNRHPLAKDGYPLYTDGYHETDNFIRFRQFDNDNDKFNYRTQVLKNNIRVVMGYPK
jgi:hypothetical protein